MALLLALLAPRAYAEAPTPKPLAASILVPLPLGRAPFVDLDAASTKLAELHQLGADAVLLSPLFLGTREPPHAVVDHLQIDPSLGGGAAFERFVKVAAGLGLRVVVELHANDVSIQHEWFRVAQRGDRFHRALFVLAPELPSGASEAPPSKQWSFDADLGAHYYHAAGPGRADLQLRDEALRTRIIAIAKQWQERGVGGFVVLGARNLFEDGPQRRFDHPESLAFFQALRRSLPRTTALVAEVKARAPVAASYFGQPDDGADLVLEHDRLAGLRDATEGGAVDLLVAALVRAESLRPNTGAWSVRATEERELPAALLLPFLLTSGGQPWLDPEHLRAPEAQALVALRRMHPALAQGSFDPVPGGPPGLLVFLRRDGLDEVFVAIAFADAVRLPLSLFGPGLGRIDLSAATVHRAEVAASGELVTFEKGGVFVAPRKRRSLPLRIEIATRRNASFKDEVLIEPGAPFEETRGYGFESDQRQHLQCESKGRSKSGPSCALPFVGGAGFEPGTRFRIQVPVGAHRVGVTATKRPKSGELLIEGEPAAATRSGFERVVFARDGFITVEAAPEVTISVSSLEVGSVVPGVVRLEARLEGPSLEIVSPVGGELLWRMDESSTEPVESAKLGREGPRFSAVLGPWPAGVRVLRLLVRDEKGRLFAGEGGAEIVVSRPSGP